MYFEVKFTEHKMDYFKVRKWVAFSSHVHLYNLPPLSGSRTFIIPKGNPVSHEQPLIPSLSPWQPLICSLSAALPALGGPCEWNPRVRAFHAWLLSLSVTFSRFMLYVDSVSAFVSFCSWITVHCMEIARFVYPFISDGRWGCFRLWAIGNRLLWAFV